MGLRSTLRLLKDPLFTPSEGAATAGSTVLKTWSGGDVAQSSLLPVSVAEAFGINISSDHVNRQEAMFVPAVRRGRQVIAGTLGAAPLIAMRTRAGQSPEKVFRQLLVQPDPNVSRAYTMTWTLDDLLFYGVAWWRVLEWDEQNYPKRAERLHQSRIRVDVTRGEVYVDGRKITNPREIIRFDGPDEGILTYGARALKTAILLETAVRNYARMDIPLGLIIDEMGSLTTDEAQQVLDSWESARAKRSTGYLPQGLKYQNPSFNAEQVQLGEARGFQAQEIARLLNLPASYINAPTNDSLTYSTTESNRRELVDMTFAPYIAAIEQRLSMGDVTPLGTSVSFDLGKFLRGDMRSLIEMGKAAVESGLMTVNEVRTEWLGLSEIEQETTGAN